MSAVYCTKCNTLCSDEVRLAEHYKKNHPGFTMINGLVHTCGGPGKVIECGACAFDAPPGWVCPECNGVWHTPIGVEGCLASHETKRLTQDLDRAIQGTKTDASKPRWSLLPVGTIVQVIKVLEFGAAKYSVGNWAHVPDARTRYYDAAMRHLEAWFRGEKDDTESGLPHLAHAACCVLFLMWFDEEKRDAS